MLIDSLQVHKQVNHTEYNYNDMDICFSAYIQTNRHCFVCITLAYEEILRKLCAVDN